MQANYRHVPTAEIAQRVERAAAESADVTVELIGDWGAHWEADAADFTEAGLAAALSSVDDAGGPWLHVDVGDVATSYFVEGGIAYEVPS